ncbi:MAG: di-heme enzyme, partial [Pseudomonadota bacterium]
MNATAWRRALAAGAVVLALGAPGAQPPGDAALLDYSPAERAAILRHGPWPPPPARDPGNAWSDTPAARALGQRLFFEPRLSADARLACASCHQPALAFADALERSPGRLQPDGHAVLLDRNAPSLWNAVHERWQGWDGAADSLWSQTLRPLLDEREMATTPA